MSIDRRSRIFAQKGYCISVRNKKLTSRRVRAIVMITSRRDMANLKRSSQNYISTGIHPCDTNRRAFMGTEKHLAIFMGRMTEGTCSLSNKRRQSVGLVILSYDLRCFNNLEVLSFITVSLSFPDVYDDDDDESERTWPETPPPLPPRLRHLPPVHMNFEERHKIAGRSRSLPPPPPYRPPPQPRGPISSRHLRYSRSIVDDESYV